MLFHVTVKHDYETCPLQSVQETVDEYQSWVDGSDKVKVLPAQSYPLGHRVFGLIEADDFEPVFELFAKAMEFGTVEPVPVFDTTERRRRRLAAQPLEKRPRVT